MDKKERLTKIRQLMKDALIDAYIVNNNDPHLSEYPPEYWKIRSFLSGFTGSYGTLVITANEGVLWTDSRYLIQAAKQLKDTGIKIFQINKDQCIGDWLYSHLEINSTVGLNGFCFNVTELVNIKSILVSKNIVLDYSVDFISELWTDRPLLSKKQIIEQDIKYAGVSRKEKLDKIRKIINGKGAYYHLIASLDDICWTLNIRGFDVECNPVVSSYLLISPDLVYLFIDKDKIDHNLAETLESDGISLKDYDELVKILINLNDRAFLVDPQKINFKTFMIIDDNFPIITKSDPSILLKSIKNSNEIQGAKKACLKDGIALTKFWYWLEKNINMEYSEIDISKKLRTFREEQDGFIDESFSSIVAYKEDAALPHYSASGENCSKVRPKGLLLIDSGGQYIEGTTDITRTMPVGELSNEEKYDYTLVLKGMITLSLAIFPLGTTGCNIDVLARKSLWEHGLNYGHGTGHGVGSFLNVHEGPQSIRQELNSQAILPGMITSNEPGLYKEGRHGIRHENLILCKKYKETEFGEFLNFETLTLCYIDTSAVVKKLLTDNEIEWLNNYNSRVFKEISPYVDEDHKNWLKIKTQAI